MSAANNGEQALGREIREASADEDLRADRRLSRRWRRSIEQIRDLGEGADE